MKNSTLVGDRAFEDCKKMVIDALNLRLELINASNVELTKKRMNTKNIYIQEDISVSDFQSSLLLKRKDWVDIGPCLCLEKGCSGTNKLGSNSFRRIDNLEYFAVHARTYHQNTFPKNSWIVISNEDKFIKKTAKVGIGEIHFLTTTKSQEPKILQPLNPIIPQPQNNNNRKDMTKDKTPIGIKTIKDSSIKFSIFEENLDNIYTTDKNSALGKYLDINDYSEIETPFPQNNDPNRWDDLLSMVSLKERKDLNVFKSLNKKLEDIREKIPKNI